MIFLDTKGATPGFVELFEATPAVEERFTGFWRASVGWTGEDPVRPF